MTPTAGPGRDGSTRPGFVVPTALGRVSPPALAPRVVPVRGLSPRHRAARLLRRLRRQLLLQLAVSVVDVLPAVAVALWVAGTPWTGAIGAVSASCLLSGLALAAGLRPLEGRVVPLAAVGLAAAVAGWIGAAVVLRPDAGWTTSAALVTAARGPALLAQSVVVREWLRRGLIDPQAP